jgi:hypothetical protein
VTGMVFAEMIGLIQLMTGEDDDGLVANMSVYVIVR